MPIKVERRRIEQSLRRIAQRTEQAVQGPSVIADEIVPTIPVSTSDAQLVTRVYDTDSSSNFNTVDLFEGDDSGEPWIVQTSGGENVLASGYRARLIGLHLIVFNSTGANLNADIRVRMKYDDGGVERQATIWRREFNIPDGTFKQLDAEFPSWQSLFKDLRLRPGDGLEIGQENAAPIGVTAQLFYRYDVAEEWVDLRI